MEYKTLLQWFKDLSLNDKLDLYNHKMRSDVILKLENEEEE